ncbi:uncharacterized protein [Montipora foliosa]|uniref:uncharacterized protein n=1 Tax=Montipora foliosa TaxID=591990 RepID=UPI0035F11081
MLGQIQVQVAQLALRLLAPVPCVLMLMSLLCQFLLKHKNDDPKDLTREDNPEEIKEEKEEAESSDSEPQDDDEEGIEWLQQEESSEAFSSQSEDEIEEDETANTITVDQGTPAQDEPKFIVFFTQLLGLFSLFCFKCKTSDPRVTMKQRGTMVIASQQCQHCGDEVFVWKSQPMTLGGKHPLGNILISFGILMAGASISKVLLVFKHMGLSAFSARTVV